MNIENADMNNPQGTHVESELSIGELFESLDESDEVTDSDPIELDNHEDVIEDDESESDEEEVYEDDVSDDEDADEVDETEEEDTFTIDDDYEVSVGDSNVKFAELKQGYLRHSDYTKKTQELAAQRKEVETNAEMFTPAIKKAVKDIEDTVAKEGGWNQVRAKYPEQAEQMVQQYVAMQKQAKAIDDFMDNTRKQHEELAQQELTANKQNAVKELQMAIPNLTQQVLHDMASYAIDSGYEPDEIDKIADSKTWLLIHKAMMHDMAKSKLEEVKTVTNKVKRTSKPTATPKGKQNNFNGKTNVDKALDIARKTKDPLTKQQAIRQAFADI